MDMAPRTTDVLCELADVTATATTTDDLLSRALPVLLDMAGARSVFVVRRLAGEQVITAHAGIHLPVDASSADWPAEVTTLRDFEVPELWVARGIVEGCLRRLPGKTGVLVLARGLEAPPFSRQTEAAITMICAAADRLHTAQQLSDLNVRVDRAQQLANVGDYDFHFASDTIRCSDQLYRMYGFEPQSFTPTLEWFRSRIPADESDRVYAVYERAWRSGEPCEVTQRFVRADGRIAHLLVTVEVLTTASGVPVRMRGTCLDVTQRVLDEQARRRGAERFRSLVESVPEAIVVLDTENQVVQANAHAAELLGAEPIGRAINEILPDPPADLPVLGVEATGLDGRSLRLDVTTAELSLVDDQRLVAVFLRDATSRLNSEALAVSLREAQVRRRQALEINDNVVQGLTAAVVSMMQGHMASSTSYLERTLSAARQLMDDWLEPLSGEGLEPGDLVRAAPSTLRHEPATGVGTGVGTEPPPSQVTKARILIADDNIDVRKTIRELVESYGKYEVVGEAGDGEEAVHIAAQLRPDVVLLDLSMPRMDGLEALPLILDAVVDIKVIILSGFAERSVAQTVLNAGAARYVEKGLNMNLDAVIQDVFTASRANA